MSEVRTNQKNKSEVIPPNLAIKAMRDSGYKNTAYALAELIDNSIQADAGLVEVFCTEEQLQVNTYKGKRISGIAVLDNGSGMDADTLQSALQFGNGTHLHDRSGIGRFGMGLPNASISQCRRVDVWSWQAGPDNAIHTYLDLSQIESGEIRHVPQPEAKKVPREWWSMSEDIGTSGTLVVWSGFEDYRLTWKGARATLDNTEALSGRMYRKFLYDASIEIRLVALEEGETEPGLDRKAKANDPLYLMESSSTPAPFDEKPMFQPWGKESEEKFPIELDGETHNVIVRMSWARPETIPEEPNLDRGRTAYGKHAAKNIGLSVLRAGRELELDNSWANGEPTERWWGIEVEFSPALDEVFGVTNNKQAARTLSHMVNFSWESEAESGETFMNFRRRLEEEEDIRYQLIEVVHYIRDQLSQIRKRLEDQTKGRRSNAKRHEDYSVEDAASRIWNRRRDEGNKAETDEQQYNEESRQQLVEDLTENKHYDQVVANEIADAVGSRGRRVIFVIHEVDSPAFFNVEPRPGGVTEVVFNSRHPAYERLVKALDTDTTGSSESDLSHRIHNASDTLKLLFAAWARYEQEDTPSRERIREMRYEWGRMANNFLED